MIGSTGRPFFNDYGKETEQLHPRANGHEGTPQETRHRDRSTATSKHSISDQINTENRRTQA
jgi:hypothetical protein